MFKFDLLQVILFKMRFLSFILTIFYVIIFPTMLGFVILPIEIFLPIFSVISMLYLSLIIAPSWIYVILKGAKRVSLENSIVSDQLRKVFRGKRAYPYIFIFSNLHNASNEIIWGKRREYLLVNEKFLTLPSHEIKNELDNILIEISKSSFYFDSVLKSFNLFLLSIIRFKYKMLKKIFRSPEISFSIVMLIYFIYIPFFYLSEKLLEKNDLLLNLKTIGCIDRNLFNIENKVIY